MLSTFAARSGTYSSILLKSQAPRVLAVVPAGVRHKSESAKLVEQWDEAHKIFYGPERDTKNFPHPVMPQNCPKVRMGFIPDEWFQFFYNKTGVTGPYLFGFGLLTTLLSKEIWVIDHGFAEVVGFYGAILILTKKLGPRINNWLQKNSEAMDQANFIQPVLEAKSSAQQSVDDNEKAIWQEEGQKYLWEAKREHVALQLEADYRRRLNEVYREVKKRLDYQLEVENAKRRFEQTHMVNWIVESVKKGITPQQEQESIKVCINQLKQMSAATA